MSALDKALRYAEKDWQVFPLKPGAKTPLTTHGCKDATTSPDVIKQWWLRHPTANVGIATGKASNLVAFDFDVKKGQRGKETYMELLDKVGTIETLTSTTPSGGWHLLFQYPDIPVGNSAGLLPGLDIRGDGGYIVAPGSSTPDGAYTWKNHMPPGILPDPLKELLVNGKEKAESEPFNRNSILDGIPEGQRDDKLYRYVCSLQARGTTQAEAEILVREAALNCKPPFNLKLALEKVARVYQQYDEPQENKLILTPVCVADWQGKPIPARQWSWSTWLPKGTVAGLGGAPGVAKSLFAQQLCTHKALGGQFLGCDIPMAAALYITCEDELDELMRRQNCINAALNIQMDDIPDLHVDSWHGDNAQLVIIDKGVFRRTRRFTALDELIGDLKAEIVTLDLLADMWNGNECDRQAVNGFIKSQLAHLSQRHHTTILGLYHPSLSGMASGTGTSGSTAWDGSFRSRLYLKMDEDTGSRILTRPKSNYATTDDEHRLVWKDWYLLPESKLDKTSEEKQRDYWKTAFHTCLQHCDQKGIEVSPAPNSGHYYGKQFPEMWKNLDRRHRNVTRKQFEKVYMTLVAIEGTVKIVKDSRNQKGDRLNFVGYQT